MGLLYLYLLLTMAVVTAVEDRAGSVEMFVDLRGMRNCKALSWAVEYYI